MMLLSVKPLLAMVTAGLLLLEESPPPHPATITERRLTTTAPATSVLPRRIMRFSLSVEPDDGSVAGQLA